MAKDKDKGPQKDVETEVWTAISAFEQILEAMPNDRASLDALSHAYEQIGDHTRAKDYLLRFANVLIEEADGTAGAELLPKLEKYADQDEVVKEAVASLKGLADKVPDAAAASAKKASVSAKVKSKDGVSSGFNMSEEMSFAWSLSEAQQITQDEYASVVQDLTEMSSAASSSTVSVLHVLENRGFKNLEKIMAYVAKECNTPIIALSAFNLRREALSILPSEMMLRRGVMVYELLGTDALVAVMNPYDKQLQKDIEIMTDRPCHFYMTLPSDFDKALSRLPEILEGDDEDE